MATLLSNTQNNMQVTGPAIAVDRWVSLGDNLFTAAIHVANFRGTVTIQGSLAATPSEDDWFSVVEPIAYPRSGSTNETSNIGINFRGNYTFLRAVMTRPGLTTTPSPSAVYGVVDRILLNQ